MPGPLHQWLYLEGPNGPQEIFNGARTAAYLSNAALTTGMGISPCDVLGFGGCLAYAYEPPCGADLDSNYALWPGSQSVRNVLTIPDNANFSAPTNLDIRFAVGGIAAESGTRTLAVHRDSGAANIAWQLQFNTSDVLLLGTSTNGSSVTTATCDVAFTTTDTPVLGRVTWRSSDGRTQFFRKTIFDMSIVDTLMAENTGWTQLGTNETASTAALFNSTALLSLGNQNATTLANPFIGRLYAFSLATTIDANPVYNIRTTDWPRGVTPASFPASTSQTVTVTTGTPAMSFIFDELEGWDALFFSTPAADNAPWYDSTRPESAQALGFFIEEWTGLDSRHVQRPVQRRHIGGQLGAISSSERVMKFNIIAMASTEAGLEHLYRWLESTMLSVCSSCAVHSALIRRTCPNIEDLWTGVAELREVGLIEGFQWEDDPVDIGRCMIRRLSFTLAAGDPCMYSNTSPTGVVDPAVPSTCYAALPLATGKADCRPLCVELPASCTAVFSFVNSSNTTAVAPIVTLDNAFSTAVLPLRIVTYADPNNVGGGTPNLCGLPILGELYTKAIPPWSTLIWDVAGRTVRYRDHETGVFTTGWAYADANDRFIPRFFTLPCAVSRISIEPATTCIINDVTNSRYIYEGTIVAYADVHYPTMTVELQERLGCA